MLLFQQQDMQNLMPRTSFCNPASKVTEHSGLNQVQQATAYHSQSLANLNSALLL